MEIEPVGGVSTAPTRVVQPAGVTAELAQARAKLRESAPPDRWDAVMDEVRRLQTEESMPPLAPLQRVYGRLGGRRGGGGGGAPPRVGRPPLASPPPPLSDT